MKFKLLLFLLFVLVAGCKTQTPNTKDLDKNGPVIISLERTPCFGRCPIYSIKIYGNGLLVYDAQKFNDTTGVFCSVISKTELETLKTHFNNSGFFQMADKYPEDAKSPTDLPSCIVYYNNGSVQKTVTDKRFKTPETLTGLEREIDALVNFKKLQFCDK